MQHFFNNIILISNDTQREKKEYSQIEDTADKVKKFIDVYSIKKYRKTLNSKPLR